MVNVRPAAVAGSFYPADPHELRSSIERLLAAQRRSDIDLVPMMFIVPHAGHIYSGPVAATAYQLLGAMPDHPEHVVLVGPSHFVRFPGMATPGVDAMATPLGLVPVDRELTSITEAFEVVAPLPAAHSREHSLEVQLPFLQVALGNFEVLPLLTGDVTPDTTATVLDAALDTPGAIGVISSDLSHYLDYDAAYRKDASTAEAITGLRPEDLAGDDACGRTGVQAALLVARRRGWACRLLALANSADTVGPLHRVVGYGAFVLGPKA